MANSPQLQQMAFAAGIDQSQHGEVLEPSSGFVTLENVRQDRRGGVSKRLGFEALPSTRMGSAQGRTSGKRVFDANGIACVFDGESIDAYSDQKNAFAKVAAAPAMSVKTRDIATTGDLIDDVVFVNGYIVSSTYVVSEFARGTYDPGSTNRIYRLQNVVTIETEDGTVIRSSVPVFEAIRSSQSDNNPNNIDELLPEQHLQRSRLAFHGTWVFLFCHDPVTRTVYGFKLDTSNPTSDWQALPQPIAEGYAVGFGVCSAPDHVVLAVTKFNKEGSTLNAYPIPKTRLESFYGGSDQTHNTEFFVRVKYTQGDRPTEDATAYVINYDMHISGQRLIIGSSASRLRYDDGSEVGLIGIPFFGVVSVHDRTTFALLSARKTLVAIEYLAGNLSDGLGVFLERCYVLNREGVSPNNFYLVCPNIFSSSTLCVKMSLSESSDILFDDGVLVFGAYVSSRPLVYQEKLYGLTAKVVDINVETGLAILSGSRGWSVDVALGSLALCDMSTVWEEKRFSPVAIASPDLCGFGAYSLLSMPSGVVSVYGVKRSASSFSVEMMTATPENAESLIPCEHNGVIFFTGGVLTQFDGANFTEAPFLFRPRKPDLSYDIPGGIGTQSPEHKAAFSYVITYETTDALGNVYSSAASAPASIDNYATATNNGYTELKAIRVRLDQTAVTLRRHVSGRGPVVKICIWRTNETGEPPYYLVSTVENTTVDYQGYFDDYALKQRFLDSPRLLYGTGSLPGTNGAAQDRRAPPYATALASYNGMLIVASGRDLWYSGQAIDGEGVWFNPAFVVTVPDNQNVTALAVLESTLYAFTARSVYAVAGDAPSDNGFSGGLGVPRRLAADVGCIDARSVVVCTLGIFFQSARGIELLNRGGSVTFIGQNVQETMAAYPVITSATLDDFAGLIRFTAQSKDGASGVHLVFDLTTNLWQSVDRVTGSTQNAPASHACMITKGGRRRFAWLSSDGTLYAEKSADDERAYFDGVSWVSMAAEFGWTKFGGIQGRHFLNRALLLAKRETSANVCTSVFYDYSDEPTSIVVRSASTVDRVNSSINRIQLDNVFANESAGVSVKLRVEDRIAAGGFVGNGKGSTWLSVSFEGVPVEGATLLPEGAS
jgi:hypothetical protein